VSGRRRGRGRFVVLEGLDGAGTTTQARLLGDRLRTAGRRVHVTAEPSAGPIGALIRQVLSRRLDLEPAALALLFAADRRDHCAVEIVPALERGIDVVSDRFTLSSLAYQGITLGDPEWVEAINARAAVPDVTVFLRARPAVTLARRRAASQGRELYEVDAFQRRVARSYTSGIARLRAAGQRVEFLDGEAPVEEVAEAIWRVVARLPRGRG
jgi:dTMP kinase